MNKMTSETKESIVKELNEAIINLKAGRNNEVYNILTDLSDELTTDVIISRNRLVSRGPEQ